MGVFLIPTNPNDLLVLYWLHDCMLLFFFVDGDGKERKGYPPMT